MKSIWYYEIPLGIVGIAETDNGISNLFFHEKEIKDEYVKRETPLLQKAAAQLREYFQGKRQKFDLPLSLRGTEFQQSIWKALQDIPYGETRSYKQVAEIIGSPKASRAVGMANNRNPVLILVPCHRVVGHNGGMTGYAGGLPAKEFLLELERAHA